jgi:uncharacterized membrane protein
MTTPTPPTPDKNTDAARYEVLMAAYLFVAPGRTDYDALTKLMEDHTITVEGVVLVSKDHAGEMHIEDGGTGIVLGLLEPSWLAKTSIGKGIGSLAGKFGTHRAESGIEKKLAETLAAGDALLMAIYDLSDADAVRKAVTNSPKTSFAEIDGKSVKDLKAGMAEAQAGMAG